MNEKPLFAKRDLYLLIFPLVIEQLLAMTVGIADTIMVSSAGEAAMSGVNLVDAISILLIQMFSAMASGGAVVCCQYIGRNDKKNALETADQLLLTVTAVSTAIGVIAFVGNRFLLSVIYRNIEADVMENAVIYFYLNALSFPFLGLYNACAALCRSMGNSKITMKVSLLMNLINVVGNAIFIYAFHMNASGVGASTLIARMIAAAIMFVIIRNPALPIHTSKRPTLTPNFSSIRRICFIGIPSGLESSMFQLGKILTTSIVASLGTAAIAANAAAGALGGFENIPGNAIGLSLITVIGQSVGAQRFDEAKKYLKWHIIWTQSGIAIVSIGMIIFARPLLSCFHLSDEAFSMAYQVFMLHSIFSCVIWGCSFTLPNAFRAAGDAKFPMVISMLSMWICRIVFSYIFAGYFGMGLFGVWLAMILDWWVRAIIFIVHLLSGRWLKKAIPD